MNLLHTTELKVKEVENNTRFAILSHTWGKEEISYHDIKGSSDMETKEGYEKIKKVCAVAAADGFDYVWVDTCCIDKASSAALSEAINSMYRWYQEAEVCYAHLEDVPSREFSESRWFTRGWTLQELIAPSIVRFFDKNWEIIGTKSDLAKLISTQTRIPISILLGGELSSATIAQRMSWASMRQTTRVEDIGYCLMGLFNVHMPMIYGEGERAFIRLQEQIMKSSDDLSLFAWRSMKSHGGLLATSPAAFYYSHDVIRLGRFNDFSSPITVGNQGIHLKLRFIPQTGSQLSGFAVLNCTQGGNLKTPLAIHLTAKDFTGKYFTRVQSGRFYTISQSIFSWPERDICVQQPNVTQRKNSDRMRFKLKPAEPPLKYALKHGLKSMAESLLEDDDKSKVWPLWRATVIGDEALDRNVPLSIKLASENEVLADLLGDETTPLGQKPLLWAAQTGQWTIVRGLLESGAELTYRDDAGRTALAWAAMHGHKEVVKELCSEIHRFSETDQQDNYKQLLHAAKKGYLEVVQLLSAEKVDGESNNTDGWMPLWLALVYSHEGTVKLLLENEEVDDSQWTALWLAVEWHWARGGCEGPIAAWP